MTLGSVWKPSQIWFGIGLWITVRKLFVKARLQTKSPSIFWDIFEYFVYKIQFSEASKEWLHFRTAPTKRISEKNNYLFHSHDLPGMSLFVYLESNAWGAWTNKSSKIKGVLHTLYLFILSLTSLKLIKKYFFDLESSERYSQMFLLIKLKSHFEIHNVPITFSI